MTPRRKSALLWGAVGVFAFLALHQGYILLGNDGIGILPALVVALVVGAMVAVSAYVGEARLVQRGR